MSIQELQALARACFLAAQGMTAEQMDQWYVGNVGYSLAQDCPSMSLVKMGAQVAGMMFFGLVPGGVDEPGAERVERVLEHVIECGADQAGEREPYHLLCPSDREVALHIERGPA